MVTRRVSEDLLAAVKSSLTCRGCDLISKLKKLLSRLGASLMALALAAWQSKRLVTRRVSEDFAASSDSSLTRRGCDLITELKKLLSRLGASPGFFAGKARPTGASAQTAHKILAYASG